MYKLSKRSLKALEGVNPELVSIVKRAIEITDQDFTVVEGLRTLETQKKYLARGASRTLKSYHLTGHAVDLYPYYDGSVQCEAPWARFEAIKDAMFKAADELGISGLEWGGNWKTFKDTPHFQLVKK